MTRPYVLSVVVVAAFGGCATPDAPRPASPPVPYAATMETRWVESTPAVEMTIHPGVEPATAAIVFLHGVGGSNETWSGLGGPETLRTIAAARQQSTPLVVAVKGDPGGWPDLLDETVSWGRVLSEELPAYLRASFGDRLNVDRVAYLGTSAGASKALAMAFRHPDRFGCVAAHSPALHDPDPANLPAWAREWDGWRPLYGLPIDPLVWQSKNPIHLASTLDPAVLGQLGLYFDVGVEDHLGFNETTAQLSATLASRGLPHVFALRSGGHGDDYTAANLQHSLDFLLQCLSERG